MSFIPSSSICLDDYRENNYISYGKQQFSTAYKGMEYCLLAPKSAHLTFCLAFFKFLFLRRMDTHTAAEILNVKSKPAKPQNTVLSMLKMKSIPNFEILMWKILCDLTKTELYLITM